MDCNFSLARSRLCSRRRIQPAYLMGKHVFLKVGPLISLSVNLNYLFMTCLQSKEVEEETQHKKITYCCFKTVIE